MVDEEFFDIANALVAEEANEYLDGRLKKVASWLEHREEVGKPADLRSLIEQLIQEPNERSAVIVSLAAALWRIREMEKAGAQR